ncbi:hypothetical protein, partial [Pseudomonas aeruginosa]
VFAEQFDPPVAAQLLGPIQAVPSYERNLIMIMSILAALDALLCVLVVVAALEFLRTVQLSGQPLLGISFYLVAGGAFGILYGIMKGAPVNPFSVILHAGLVLYAWSRRRQIFGSDWSWN